MADRAPMSFIATSEPTAAKAFYADILGLTLIEDSPYALAFADGGQMLRVQIVEGYSPPAYTVHGWQVSDLKEQIKELSAKGVAFLRYEQLQQDASGIWTTPDGNKIAWFTDPDGAILSLTEYAARSALTRKATHARQI